MQPDAIADQPRREHHALQHLADTKHREGTEHMPPIAKLQQCCGHREHHPDDHPKIRHKTDKARDDSDHKREINADQPQPAHINSRECSHHGQLSAHEFREYCINFARDKTHAGFDLARQ